MKKRRYVVVEGIDGSGKTTLCKGLHALYPDRIVLHREPSDGPIGRLIRESVVPGKPPLDSRVMTTLFLADRAINLRSAISKLPPGGVLLSDRSFLSSIAYQTGGWDLETLWTVHETLPKPDTVIYMSCPVPVALARIHGPARRSTDTFEREDTLVEAHRRYCDALNTLHRQHGTLICGFDGTADPDTIVAQAAQDLWLAGK